MKLELFNTEAGKIWKKATAEAFIGKGNLELDAYNKLFNLFQVGDYFYWVFNFKSQQLDMVSDEVSSILGYAAADFTVERMMEIIHPDDRPYFLNFENRAGEFLTGLSAEKLMKYKTRYDFRMKNTQGKYLRFLHQSVIIQHDYNGHVLRSFGSEMDITYLKPDGKPTLSFIGLDGEPSYINVDVDKIFTVSDEILSKREKQILLLIMEGKLSKEISTLLNISKQTVDSHRNNMLTKCNVANTNELIAKAIRQGWV